MREIFERCRKMRVIDDLVVALDELEEVGESRALGYGTSVEATKASLLAAREEINLQQREALRLENEQWVLEVAVHLALKDLKGEG